MQPICLEEEWKKQKDFFAGQEGGRRYLPYAFTEQGIYMFATVLRGKLAEQQSIFIMRTFREMRHYIRQNQQFVTRNEMDLLTAKVGTITERQDRMENKVDSIQKDVNILADNFITDKDKKNFVIYKGQKLEADIAYIEIYQQAKKSIYVVDDYMNAKSLQHLSQKADGVEVVLFTENGKGGKGFLTKSLVTDFQNEYHSLQIKPNPDCHDRLIVLDYDEETELVYHCGASSKDAGKKLCAIYVNTDLGANGIAKYLENHGIHKIARQNGKNRLFDAALIRRIIQNPVYSGKISYGRRRTEKVHGTRNEYRQVKKDDYLLVDGLHEALVSEEVWEQAQVKVAAQVKKYEKVNRDKREKIHLLSGI